MPRACAWVAVTLLALAAAPAACAFDTGPHNDMTVDAMTAEGFGRPAADVIAVTRTYNTNCEKGTGEARADSTNIVDESDESNNVTTAGPYFC